MIFVADLEKVGGSDVEWGLGDVELELFDSVRY